ERGAVAMRFWRNGLERLLTAIEGELARHCLVVLELDAPCILATMGRSDAMAKSDHVLLDHVESEAYDRAWGKWKGREPALYRACADLVDKLAWNDVLAVTGPEVKLLASVTRSLHRAVLETSTPKRLRLGSFRVVGATRGSVRVAGYSGYDPVD